MKYFPVSLKVRKRRVVVIGGGHVAEQRVEALVECEAHVVVVAPEITERLKALASSHSIELRSGPYAPGDLSGAWAALTTTSDPAINAAVWHEAQERGIPINVADDPQRCDFIMPALLRRGDLTIAVSTGGASPALAARVRRRIAGMFGPEYERLLEALRRTRVRLKEAVPDARERRRLHYRIVDSNILSWILEADAAQVDRRIEEIVRDPSRVRPAPSGVVYIVGAGPGDPGLITVRGLDCLHMADVILHDRLIDRRLLEEAPSGSEVIDVGKRIGDRGRMQDFIHDTMVKRASRGQIVCRLKGGDPFVFGRGGEEAYALSEANVPFEIVPGVTSAVAAPAAAGIPVTHRSLAHAFMVMTGSRSEAATPEEWLGAASVIAGGGTLVVLMGLSHLATIVERLRGSGCDADTPAAIVARGTWKEQEVRVGTLSDIEDWGVGVESPAVIVFGVTVGERERLQQIRDAINRPADAGRNN